MIKDFFKKTSITLLLIIGCTSMQQQREAYLAQHPEVSSEARRAILNGQVVKNMTQEQVQIAWGPPTRTTTTQYEDKDMLVWFYDTTAMTDPNKIVSFMDGKVSSFTISE